MGAHGVLQNRLCAVYVTHSTAVLACGPAFSSGHDSPDQRSTTCMTIIANSRKCNATAPRNDKPTQTWIRDYSSLGKEQGSQNWKPVLSLLADSNRKQLELQELRSQTEDRLTVVPVVAQLLGTAACLCAVLSNAQHSEFLFRSKNSKIQRSHDVSRCRLPQRSGCHEAAVFLSDI